MMVGLLMPVVAAGAGAAVDFGSAQNKKSALQRAADSAALAGARNQDMKIFAVEKLASENALKAEINNITALAVRTDEEIEVTISGKSNTYILGLVGIDTLDIQATSTAAHVSGAPKNLEVALALDVTESMENDMGELRDAAESLVQELFAGGSEQVKVSIIPYAGAVNIGNSADRMDWLDTAGNSQHHAMDIVDRSIVWCYTPPPPAPSPDPNAKPVDGTTTPMPPAGNSCKAICGCPGTPDCGGGGDGASLLTEPAKWFAEIAGIKLAHASASVPVFNPDLCTWHDTPSKISHLDLFDEIQGVDWDGCVEARPAPFDSTDEPWSADNPDTMFVPYFWSDDYDQYGDGGYTWANDYVDDQAAPVVDSTREIDADGSVLRFDNWEVARRSNVWKYATANVSDMNLVAPNITGPNRGCPDKLLDLSADEYTVRNKIQSLEHRKGGGTVISQGLVWAWRTLSPGKPFTQGLPYDEEETKKIVIVMSDGANSIIKREDSSGDMVDWDRRGDYTAYGYAADFDQKDRTRGHIDTSKDNKTPYFRQIRNFLDARTLEVCDNIKGADAENPPEIYTVLLGGDSDADAVEMLKQCATTRENHYERAIRASDLKAAFDNIFAGIIGNGSARLVK